MKFRLLTLVASLAFSLVACNDDSPVAAKRDSVGSADDLGKCSSKNEGESVLVEEDDVEYFCEDGEWIKEEGKSSATAKSSSSKKGDGKSSAAAKSSAGAKSSSSVKSDGKSSAAAKSSAEAKSSNDAKSSAEAKSSNDVVSSAEAKSSNDVVSSADPVSSPDEDKPSVIESSPDATSGSSASTIPDEFTVYVAQGRCGRGGKVPLVKYFQDMYELSLGPARDLANENAPNFSEEFAVGYVKVDVISLERYYDCINSLENHGFKVRLDRGDVMPNYYETYEKGMLCPINDLSCTHESTGGVCDLDGNYYMEKTEDGKTTTSFEDIRDHQVYVYVNVGKQVWMGENLNYNTADAVCYNGSHSKDLACSKQSYGRGRFYDGNEASEVCPKGWHLPSVDEFNELIETAGGKAVAGHKLKAKKGWASGSAGLDVYGFNANPVGFGFIAGGEYRWTDAGESAVFWSSTENPNMTFSNYAFTLASDTDEIGDIPASWNSNRLSIRCIRD